MEWLTTIIGGINLVFLLKLIYNDVEHLQARLDQHIDDHAKGAYDYED